MNADFVVVAEERSLEDFIEKLKKNNKKLKK